jgi:ribosomal-protein-alanine N-acetyltransferase
MALTPLLRPAAPADAAALAAIELESFPDPSWTAEDFLRYDCTVAELGSIVAGFLVSRETFSGSPDTPPEREVLNIAVKPEFRRQGLAALLLGHELKRKANIFLEVRESNVGAIQLYKNAGFMQLSRRRHYYDNPRESAIVMRLKW